MPKKNQQEYNAYMRDWHRKRKINKIADLGGKCGQCGEKRIEMLGISKGKVFCHNCREYNKIQKIGRQIEKRESIKK